MASNLGFVEEIQDLMGIKTENHESSKFVRNRISCFGFVLSDIEQNSNFSPILTVIICDILFIMSLTDLLWRGGLFL